MVVGKKEPGDISFDKRADLKLKGKTFENQSVFGDKKTPGRRDIFPGDKVRDAFPKDDLPNKGTAIWMGKKYPAKLSFRFGKGGRRIPVYQFSIQ